MAGRDRASECDIAALHCRISAVICIACAFVLFHQLSSFSRKRRGCAYSIDPIWLARPDDPNSGIDSLSFATKQQLHSRTDRKLDAIADIPDLSLTEEAASRALEHPGRSSKRHQSRRKWLLRRCVRKRRPIAGTPCLLYAFRMSRAFPQRCGSELFDSLAHRKRRQDKSARCGLDRTAAQNLDVR